MARIRLYPVKSLDPFEVKQAPVREGAGITGDRELALFNPDGSFANAKRLGARIAAVRALYDPSGRRVELRAGSETATFDLDADAAGMEHWLGERLGRPVELQRDRESGFPDDPAASGPTVISTASLEAVAGWFGLEVEETRRRFRANLEISGLEPFEEDVLFGPPDEPRRFRIGDVEMLGTNPCARCVVPSLDSRGESEPNAGFTSRFAALRERHRHPSSEIERYGHYYRLAINTRLAPGQGGKELRVGDELEVSGSDS